MITNINHIEQFNSVATFYKEDIYQSHHHGFITYTPGFDSAVPTALILPGYRGDAINGANNSLLRDALVHQGVGVVALNYSGFDHYGNDGMKQKADVATVESNIEDVHTVLSKIPSSNVMVVASSYSVNVAMQVNSPKVSDIVAISPFPNFIQERVVSLLDNIDKIPDDNMRAYVQQCSSQLESQGYFIYQGAQPLKITKAFIESARGYDAHQPSSALLENTPEIVCLYNMKDAVVTQGRDFHVVPNWLESLKDFGLSVSGCAYHHCDEHELSDDMLTDFKGIVTKKLEV